MKSSYLGRWFTSFASVDCWSVSPGHRKPKLSTCGARGWTATEVDEESTDDSDLNSESKWTDEPRDWPCARPMVSAVHRKRCPAKVSASRAWEREVGGLVSQTVRLSAVVAKTSGASERKVTRWPSRTAERNLPTPSMKNNFHCREKGSTTVHGDCSIGSQAAIDEPEKNARRNAEIQNLLLRPLSAQTGASFALHKF
jgi:hypothetical protein